MENQKTYSQVSVVKRFKKIGLSKRWETVGQVPKVFIRLDKCSLGMMDENDANAFLYHFEELCSKYCKGRWAMSAELGIYNKEVSNLEDLDVPEDS